MYTHTCIHIYVICAVVLLCFATLLVMFYIYIILFKYISIWYMLPILSIFIIEFIDMLNRHLILEIIMS